MGATILSVPPGWSAPGGSPVVVFGSRAAAIAAARYGTLTSGAITNVFASPSTYGWPDATNTGYSPTGVTLTTHSGTLTTTAANQTFDSLDITGQVIDNFGGMTLTRSRITVNQINDAAIKGSGTGSLIQDCEIRGSATALQGSYNGVQLGTVTVNRCNIYNFENPIQCMSGDSIQNSYIHDLNATYAGAAPHYDGSECQSGTGMTINHCTIDTAPQNQNSCINFSCDSGAISTVTITNNLLRGGNFVVYLDIKTHTITGVTLDNNRFGRTQQFGTLDDTGASYVHAASGNVYDDDNSVAI